MIILFLCLFQVNFVYASCGESGIDINSASLEELDEIIQIGPSRAEAIIAIVYLRKKEKK